MILNVCGGRWDVFDTVGLHKMLMPIDWAAILEVSFYVPVPQDLNNGMAGPGADLGFLNGRRTCRAPKARVSRRREGWSLGRGCPPANGGGAWGGGCQKVVSAKSKIAVLVEESAKKTINLHEYTLRQKN